MHFFRPEEKKSISYIVTGKNYYWLNLNRNSVFNKQVIEKVNLCNVELGIPL